MRPEIRGQAQSLLVWVTLGLGLLIGAQLMTWLVKENTGAEGVVDWGTVWLWPCLAAGAVLLLFVALFRNRDAAAPAQ